MSVQRILIIVVVAAVFLSFMMTYTVRFNERAVVTTLGKAGEGSVITEPGLRFKLPPPLQEVVKYDKRLRYIQSDQEAQQTANRAQVIVTSFLTWRVDDPLKFFRRFGGAGDSEREHYQEAEKILRSKLRSASSAVSQYTLQELISDGAASSKLPQVESDMLARLSATDAADGALSEYGITPVAVGISGLALPQETTEKVFESMKAARLKIANDTVSQGTSLASTIKSGAESDAKKITAFVEQLAARIRNQGDIEAAKYLEQLRDDPQLAIFLENMNFLRTAFGQQTTLVLPTSMPGLELLRPDASKNFRAGQIPGPNLAPLTAPGGTRSAAPAGAASPAGEGAAEPVGNPEGPAQSRTESRR